MRFMIWLMVRSHRTVLHMGREEGVRAVKRVNDEM